MRLRYAISAIPLLFLLPLSLKAQTIVHGQTLYGSVNWTSSMNPIIVTGDITIDEGATLTIGPGCDIRFQENKDDTKWGWDKKRSEIIVRGTLDISGTPSELVMLTSTGTGPQGWFGIIFSENTATGTIQYCNIDHSVYGINFTACDGPLYGGTAPVVSNCMINDVSVGMLFDDDSSPSITTSTIINAAIGFVCMSDSAPAITNCNTGFLAGNKMAVYATEGAQPTFTGCAFASGSVDLDMYSDVIMRDSTISDTANGIIGHESREVGSAKVVSHCRMTVDNCNIIGLGDEGNGIEWDDNLDVLKVEYSRLGGFTQIVWPRWGSIDPQAGIDHMIGPRFSPPDPRSGECTAGSNVTLVDSTVDFVELGAYVGMAIYNYTDKSSGTVTGIVTTYTTNDTLQIAGGMIGGAVNNPGDIYYFSPQAEPVLGFCTANGGNTYIIDDTVNFVSLGAYDGMIVTNETDKSTGTVIGIISMPSSTPETYNALETSGMSGGMTNDEGDIYSFTPSVADRGDYNNIDLGDLFLDPANPFRNWPPWYVAQADYSDGQNEFYGVQDPGCLFNINMEQGSNQPPNLYQLEVWAEGNWWLTTNGTVIGRYIWDYYDSHYLGAVWNLPHRTPDKKRTYSASGTIVDTIGDPAAGVRVSADISTHSEFPGVHTVLAAITDEYGYYTIYGLLPSGTPYSIIPQRLGYTFTPPSRTVTIDLWNPSDITGQDFTTVLPAPVITSVGRQDGADGADYGLPGRKNWGVRSQTTDIVVAGILFRQTPAIFLRGPLPSSSDTACSNTTFVTATNLTATVPAGMAPGDYAVRVVNPDGQENIWGSASVPGFTIVRQLAPYVTGIGPNPISSAFSGDLTVSGKNFQSGCNLLIGGYTWPGLTPGGEGTSLTVTYDSGALSAGTYAVIVTNPDEQSSNTDVTFTVNSPPPTITPLPTITPTPGPPTPTPGPPTPIPKYPRIQPITNAASYRRGETLALSVGMWPDSTNAFHNLGDLYIAVRTPNGTLLFLSKGRWKRSSAAVYKELVIGVYSSLPLGSFKIGGSFPSGTYTVYGVLNTSGTSVFNPRNWRSGLGSRSFTIQ